MSRNMTQDKPYTKTARAVDKILGKAQDGIFHGLTKCLGQKDIPSQAEYIPGKNVPLFEGTDGVLSGEYWSAGFASASVIPESRRCDARGRKDPEGKCLNAQYPTGGYQTRVEKLYTDQMMNTVVLSNNAPGHEKDVLIFISADGAGISSGTCGKMRVSVIEALKKRGLTEKNILGCNVSATHCHAALDTLGMSVSDLLKNRFRPYAENHRSLAPDMEKTLALRAAETVLAAFDRMEKGTLSFFETDPACGVNDKLNFGVAVKNTFSCFLFEGISGEKTLLTNIGAHPTSYGAWHKNLMMCADYPYFMAQALKAEGYNLVFTQSAQASVSGPYAEFDKSDEKYKRAEAFVSARHMTKRDFAKAYGAEYTVQWYDELLPSLEGHMLKGALLAQFLLGFTESARPVAPVLNVRNTESLVPFNYGVMELACVSGLLGTNVVKTPLSPSGYGVMTETDHMELGEEFVLLTAPGELSPAIVFGSDKNYKGHSHWNGNTSWLGKEWPYETLENTVRKQTGKKLIFLGITNDELGYIYPDICTPSSILGTLLFFRENPGDMSNCMLLTPGTVCGSALTKQYEKLLYENKGD